MSETSFQVSPGPWRVEAGVCFRHGVEFEPWHVRDARNVCIAVVGDVDRLSHPENRGNARLMAAAASMSLVLRVLATGRVDLHQGKVLFTNPRSPHYMSGFRLVFDDAGALVLGENARKALGAELELPSGGVDE